VAEICERGKTLPFPSMALLLYIPFPLIVMSAICKRGSCRDLGHSSSSARHRIHIDDSTGVLLNGLAYEVASTAPRRFPFHHAYPSFLTGPSPLTSENPPASWPPSPLRECNMLSSSPPYPNFKLDTAFPEGIVLLKTYVHAIHVHLRLLFCLSVP